MFNYDWINIDHFYTGGSIIFFFKIESMMLDFIDQEIASGKMKQFAVRYGSDKTSASPDESIYKTEDWWMLSTQGRDYLEKGYA